MKPVLILDGTEHKVEEIDYLNGEAMDYILIFKDRYKDLLEELDQLIAAKKQLRARYAFDAARETNKHKKHLIYSSFNKLDHEISGLIQVRDLILRLEGSQ